MHRSQNFIAADTLGVLTRFFVDSSVLQDCHGAIRCVRRDNASNHVSADVMAWLDKRKIRSEISNPGRMNRGKTVVLSAFFRL
jgi:hypothetical protein